MWDLPFEPSMLDGEHCVVINCPDEELERELAAILTAYGIKYDGGENPLQYRAGWSKYGEEFCYYVDPDIGLLHGPRRDADACDYSHFVKCTFYGEFDNDIDTESFCAVIGV